GDIISVPTWIFRGFSNIGGDENFIFTVLGQDETGGLIWAPDVLRQAEGHGLHLTTANQLIDTVAGDVLTEDVELVTPMPTEHIERMRAYSVDEFRQRVTADEDRRFSDCALLCTAVAGGQARLAVAIGYGMTEDRNQDPRVHNPHGFSVAALRAAPGQGVLRHRHAESVVLIVLRGSWQVTFNHGEAVDVVLDAHDTLSVPPGSWRSIVNVSDVADAEIIVVTSGDGRARLEWAPEVVEAAHAADLGLDANGYLAPWSLIRHSVATH
ncbi:MAG: cupin domain-containing protein, partial [Mycobacteriales bacterium]